MRRWHWFALLALPTLLGAAPASADVEQEFLLAAKRDNGSQLMTLMLRGADPNVRDERGQTALHIALKDEGESAMRSLLMHPGLDVNAANAAGETPLMLAALKGRLDWVRALAQRGAHINREGWSPLHYACSGPDRGVVAWLLANGAQLEARAPNGTTPLMMASGYGGLSTAEALLKTGADAAAVNDAGLTAAHFAERAGHANFAKQLRAAAQR